MPISELPSSVHHLAIFALVLVRRRRRSPSSSSPRASPARRRPSPSPHTTPTRVGRDLPPQPRVDPTTLLDDFRHAVIARSVIAGAVGWTPPRHDQGRIMQRSGRRPEAIPGGAATAPRLHFTRLRFNQGARCSLGDALGANASASTRSCRHMRARTTGRLVLRARGDRPPTRSLRGQ